MKIYVRWFKKNYKRYRKRINLLQKGKLILVAFLFAYYIPTSFINCLYRLLPSSLCTFCNTSCGTPVIAQLMFACRMILRSFLTSSSVTCKSFFPANCCSCSSLLFCKLSNHSNFFKIVLLSSLFPLHCKKSPLY